MRGPSPAWPRGVPQKPAMNRPSFDTVASLTHRWPAICWPTTLPSASNCTRLESPWGAIVPTTTERPSSLMSTHAIPCQGSGPSPRASQLARRYEQPPLRSRCGNPPHERASPPRPANHLRCRSAAIGANGTNAAKESAEMRRGHKHILWEFACWMVAGRTAGLAFGRNASGKKVRSRLRSHLRGLLSNTQGWFVEKIFRCDKH